MRVCMEKTWCPKKGVNLCHPEGRRWFKEDSMAKSNNKISSTDLLANLRSGMADGSVMQKRDCYSKQLKFPSTERWKWVDRVDRK